MSLEKALEANTAAVLALAEELKAFGSKPTESQPAEWVGAVEVDGKLVPVNVLKKPDAKHSKATTTPAVVAPASTEAAQPAATSTSLSYDDIKTPFLELAKRDLAAAQALIAEFGFKTLKDAKPEQYAEILARLSAE